MMKLSRHISLPALALTAVLASSCEEKQSAVAPPPPTSVSVAKPEREKVSDFVEFTGTTEAIASVDVRAVSKDF